MMIDHYYRQSPPVDDGCVVLTCTTCQSDVFRGRPESRTTIARAKQGHERQSRAAETWDWGSER